MESASKVGWDKCCFGTQFIVNMDEFFTSGLSKNSWKGWVWEVGCDFLNGEGRGHHVDRQKCLLPLYDMTNTLAFLSDQ